MRQSPVYIEDLDDLEEIENEVTRVYQRRPPPQVPVVGRRLARARARLGMVTTLIALILEGLYTDPPIIPTASAKASSSIRGTAAEVLLDPGFAPWVTELRRTYMPSLSAHVTSLGLDLETPGIPLRLVPFGGISIGEPHGGHLYGGIQLPQNPSLYTVRRPEFAYGSTHAVIHLQIALANFRRHSQYRGPLIVSDLSALQGGRHWPHISHQSGRDVDLWLPLHCDAKGLTVKGGNVATDFIDLERFSAARPQEVDWDASWQLVKALVRTGQIDGIFLARPKHHFLRQAALRDGLKAKDADEIIQGDQKTLNTMVRHVRGHDKHLHVRFRCADYEVYCR